MKKQMNHIHIGLIILQNIVVKKMIYLSTDKLLNKFDLLYTYNNKFIKLC